MTEMISRKIVISEPINDGLAGAIVAQIMEINDFDAYMENSIVNYQAEPIEMFINSPGGSATAGFAIISAMEMSTTPIVTYGIGIVASMALGIFVAGDVRIAHRFTRFMYHSVSYGTEGHITEHEDMYREANILQDMYNSLFTDRTKLTAESMAEIRKYKKDYFISGKKSVKLGIADECLEKPEKKFEMVKEEEYEEIMKEIEKLK